MTRPWFPFYPTDWRSDPGLSCCSFAAKGLWIDMIGLMHASPKYGYLCTPNGSPITPVILARLTHGAVEEVTRLLAELKANGVYSEDGGTIYSRRLVREEQRREEAVTNGKKGGNPRLKGDKGGDKPRDKGGDKGGGISPISQRPEPEAIAISQTPKPHPQPQAEPVAAAARGSSSTGSAGGSAGSSSLLIRSLNINQKIKNKLLACEDITASEIADIYEEIKGRANKPACVDIVVAQELLERRGKALKVHPGGVPSASLGGALNGVADNLTRIRQNRGY